MEIILIYLYIYIYTKCKTYDLWPLFITQKMPLNVWKCLILFNLNIQQLVHTETVVLFFLAILFLELVGNVIYCIQCIKMFNIPYKVICYLSYISVEST